MVWETHYGSEDIRLDIPGSLCHITSDSVPLIMFLCIHSCSVNQAMFNVFMTCAI